MFSLKSKLEANLKHTLEAKLYKNFRVIIHCKTLQENIEKKIKTYKGILIRSIPSIHIICANLGPNAIERLTELPEVAHIALDSFAHLSGASVMAANGIGRQERYRLTGNGVGVGIIDSGVYPHPDLVNPSNRIRGFLDLINNFRFPYDDNGHGTFMAGLIAGNGHLSKGMYKGVADNCSLYCVKAFNSIGRGYISDVLYGLDYLINLAEEWNLKVLCLPFEIIGQNHFTVSLFSKLFDMAVARGMVVVVPSGSNGNTESSMTGIATLPNCITVGGFDTTGLTVPYRHSSAGPCGKSEKPDLAAACVDICSINSNVKYIPERNGVKLFPAPLEKPYTNYTGTSCSAAFISGLCALLLENDPHLVFKDVLPLLKISCTLQNMPKSIQGSGMVNIQKLLP